MLFIKFHIFQLCKGDSNEVPVLFRYVMPKHVCARLHLSCIVPKTKTREKVVAGCLTDEEKEGKGSSIDKSKIKKNWKSQFFL